MSRHCYVLRVFTRDGVGGNHLGVVTDVTGLSLGQMQEIATGLGFSETIFIDWRESGVPYVRIFTPVREMPFAGHPLVGAAWLVSNLGPGGVDCLDCEVGRMGIRTFQGLTWIDALSDQPVEVATIDLGGWLDPEEAMLVRMPLPYLVIRLSSPDQVGLLKPFAPSGHEVCVWAWIEEGKRVRSRFFAPEAGVVEDPATGSAAVALAAVLRDGGTDKGDLIIEQGDEVGFPSRILLHWDGQRTSIGGSVVRDEVRVLTV
jgi:trans-2,3-dihydro-3-hydroxyanthranilate isomerase